MKNVKKQIEEVESDEEAEIQVIKKQKKKKKPRIIVEDDSSDSEQEIVISRRRRNKKSTPAHVASSVNDIPRNHNDTLTSENDTLASRKRVSNRKGKERKENSTIKRIYTFTNFKRFRIII